jgi:hypothetical protein
MGEGLAVIGVNPAGVGELVIGLGVAIGVLVIGVLVIGELVIGAGALVIGLGAEVIGLDGVNPFVIDD